MNTGL